MQPSVVVAVNRLLGEPVADHASLARGEVVHPAAATRAIGEEVNPGLGVVLEQLGHRAGRRQAARVEGPAHSFSRPSAASASIRPAAAPIASPHLRIPVAVRIRSESGQRRPMYGSPSSGT